jgi:hypothetical protein
MPALPVTYPADLGALDLPVASTADVLAVLPVEVAERVEAGTAPVLGAIVEALTVEHQAYQDAAAYAAAQSDPTRATGLYLDGLLGDRGVPRAAVEADDDEAYRARALTAPQVVTPPLLLAAVNEILSHYTTIKAQLFEGILDRCYIGAGTRALAFVTQDNPIDPEYDDRFYPDRPGSQPGGARVFSDSTNGRLFVLRLPVIGGVQTAYVLAGTAPADETDPGTGVVQTATGYYIGAGTNSAVTSYPGAGASTALAAYQSIANAVRILKGQGIRFRLYSDRRLVA